MKLIKKQVKEFRKTVYAYYEANKREFPFRFINNPYYVLVSEIMLQQTQTGRVTDKYREFISVFPAVETLAASQLKDVLAVWQGLGYNRRAKYLKQAAEAIQNRHAGRFPDNYEDLLLLPGIGHYTACAVLTFAYNQQHIFIETNIRTVYIHHFFNDADNVADSQILPLLEQTMDAANPRDWYYALMDYGVHLKKAHKNPSRKSKHHQKQAKFEGSNRQVRGKILKILLQQPGLSEEELCRELAVDCKKTTDILYQLEKDSMVVREEIGYYIP